MRSVIGRSAELERARSALRSARLVTFVGPAGIGKSALAGELVEGRPFASVIGSMALRDVAFGALAYQRLDTSDPSTALSHAIGLLGRFEVLVIDEPALLDPMTAVALRLAHEHLGVAIIELAQTLAGLSPDLAALITAHPGTTIVLDGLPPEACAELAISLLATGRLDGASAHLLAERSAGNPQHLIELVEEGRRSGALTHRDGVWSWRGPVAPGRTLHSLLTRRLDGLPDAQRDVLDVAALAERLPAELLATVTDRASLDATVGAGLLVLLDGAAPEATIAVPLLRDALHAELNALRRREIARRLMIACHDDAAVPEARRAMWALEAGLDAPELFREGVSAALADFELDKATALAAALQRSGGDRVQISTVLATIGRYDDAVAVLDDVVSESSSADRDATVRHATNLLLRDGTGGAAAEFLADLDDPDAQLAATRVWVELFDGDVERATATARSVLGHPAPSSNAVVWASVAGIVAGAIGSDSTLVPDAAERARGVLAEVLEQHPFVELQLDMAVTSWHVLTLDPVGALELATDRYRRAIEKAPFLAGAWAGFVGWAAKESGDFALAVERLTECVTALAPADPFGLASYARTELAAAVAMTGGEPTLPGPVSQGVFAALARRNEAWTFAARGNLLDARTALLDARRLARSRGHTAVAALAELDLTRWCGRRSDAVDLERWDLAQHSGLRRAALLIRGFDAVAASRPGHRDVQAIAAARREARRCGLATMELELGGGPQIGPVPLRSPALHGRPRTIMGLTRRETEIATLAASGRASREIAEALGVSVRTVDNHLGRIYTKVGVTRRDDLKPLFAPASPASPSSP